MEKTVNHPLILGVLHDEEHPSFEQVLSWVRNNVKPGMKIGLEIPQKGFKETNYFTRLNDEVLKAGGKPVFLDSNFGRSRQERAESERVNAQNRINKLSPWLDKRREREENKLLERKAPWGAVLELGHQYLAHTLKLWDQWHAKKVEEHIFIVLRSKFMLEKILREKVDCAIVGALHAKDFEEFAPNINLNVLYFGVDSNADLFVRPFNKELSESLKKRFEKIKPISE